MSSPAARIVFRNSCLSSAFLMDSRFAPMSSTLCFFRMPRSASATAALSAVCPPMVGRRASGFSFSMISSMNSGVIGSTYVASASSGSVMIVAGLLLMRMTL